MDMMSGIGMEPADAILSVLCALAAMITYWNIATHHSSRLLLAARWCIAVGWTILAGRLWHALLVGYDVQIAPPSLIALTLLAAGSVLRNVHEYQVSHR